MFTRECESCGKVCHLKLKPKSKICHSCSARKQGYKNRGSKRDQAAIEKLRAASRNRYGYDIGDLSKPLPSNMVRYHHDKWAAAVKERDKCCQHCRSTDNLHAHHIFPRHSHPEQKYNVHNGITLCSTCHDDVHSIINSFKPHSKFNTPYSNEDAA